MLFITHSCSFFFHLSRAFHLLLHNLQLRLIKKQSGILQRQLILKIFSALVSDVSANMLFIFKCNFSCLLFRYLRHRVTNGCCRTWAMGMQLHVNMSLWDAQRLASVFHDAELMFLSDYFSPEYSC